MAINLLDTVLPADIWSLQTLLFGVVCYLYGSVPFAYLFTYLFRKVKLTEKGTGNIGVANAFGVGGLTAGFLTVFGEATKAVLPIALSQYYYGGELTISLLLISVSILGTSFSVFLKGKGGQGGTILLWALLLLSPYTLLLYSAVFVSTFLILRRRYYTSLIGHALLPAEIFLIEGDIPFVIFGALAALFYCLRYNPQRSDYALYKKNMRLLRFSERIFGEKKSRIIEIAKAKDTSQVGMKAQRLWYLKKLGVRVPETCVFTFSAYDEYMCGNHNVLSTLRGEIEKFVESGQSYSIRSSANLEDDKDYSFAGQFESYLNVSSADRIMETTVRIWESVRGERVQAYLNRIGKSLPDLKMAVIIQEMVNAEYSGVVFTRNPVSGLDEVVIEAVTGLGSALVQSGITPERWVYKWGNWIEKPDYSELDPAVVNQLIAEAKDIEKKYKAPVDLEWAYDGKRVYWLQLRAITALKGIDIFSNKIAKGFMPGIIKPLIWSVNIPLVNTSWKRLFVELIGVDAAGIDIHKLSKSFYYRAYFNMGVIGDIFELLGMPRELLELLLGIDVPGGERPKFRPGAKTIKYLPRIIVFGIRTSMFSRKIDSFLVKKRAEYDNHARVKLDTLDEAETLYAIERLFVANTDASYYVIITELLMGFYNMVLNRLLTKRGIPADKVGFPQVREALHDIDPSYHFERLHSMYARLPEKAKKAVMESKLHGLSELPELDDFRTQVESLLASFGHLSESGNDFSRQQWKEKPELVLEMIANYKAASQRSENVAKAALSHVPPKGLFIRFFYERAVKYRIYREQVNFLYEYGYGLFRPYFLHLAECFRKEGYLDEVSDIFYLPFDEIKDIVTSGAMLEAHKVDVLRRKQEVIQWQNIELPGIIVGDAVPPPLTESQVSSRLKGVAASKGYCRGRTRLVRGIEDFPKIQEGDILVIPHSDVSWTPIFSKAKAVVSESGGMLSHCAIVAREYGIPAVVSVPRALHLPEGALVTVDGCKGEVLVMERQEKNLNCHNSVLLGSDIESLL